MIIIFETYASLKNERPNGPRKFLLSSLRVFALKKIPRKRARKTTKAKETTTTKRSAMLMTRAKRMKRKKLLTRKKTKRKRWSLHSMTTEFRRNVPKKWSLRCSKTGWNKNQTGITVMLTTISLSSIPGLPLAILEKGGARHIYPRDLRKEAMKIPGCLSMGSTVQITEAQGLKWRIWQTKVVKLTSQRKSTRKPQV